MPVESEERSEAQLGEGALAPEDAEPTGDQGPVASADAEAPEEVPTPSEVSQEVEIVEGEEADEAAGAAAAPGGQDAAEPEGSEPVEPGVPVAEEAVPGETAAAEATEEPDEGVPEGEAAPGGQDAAEPEGGESVEPAAPVAEETVPRETTAAEAAEEPDEGAPEGEAAGEKIPDDGRRWYVVHCYSGYENKVRHNLEQRIETMGMKDRIFDVVVPTEEEIEVKNGKRRTVERRVFPGYILVQMIMSEESWYVVRNTPGVTGFVGMGNEPTPLRPEEVAQIVKRMEAEAPRIKVTYKIGQKVRIIDGPFNDFIGTVSDIDMERAKVRVMVSFFGRETPVELDFLQVEKA